MEKGDQEKREKQYIFLIQARERGAIGSYAWYRTIGTNKDEVFNRFTEKYEINAVTQTAEFVRRLGDFR